MGDVRGTNEKGTITRDSENVFVRHDRRIGFIDRTFHVRRSWDPRGLTESTSKSKALSETSLSLIGPVNRARDELRRSDLIAHFRRTDDGKIESLAITEWIDSQYPLMRYAARGQQTPDPAEREIEIITGKPIS